MDEQLSLRPQTKVQTHVVHFLEKHRNAKCVHYGVKILILVAALISRLILFKIMNVAYYTTNYHQ